MRVLGMDVGGVSREADETTFGSDRSIFEYDVVFWDPVNTFATYRDQYKHRQYFRGAPCMEESESVVVIGDVERRRQEFNEFLEMGRILAVFACPPQILKVDTGKREYSGTGRNRETTRIVEDLDILTALPVELKARAGTGEAIDGRNSEFGSLLKMYPDRWFYRALLEEYPGKPLAVVANTDRPVASIKELESGGMLIVLPDIASPPNDDHAGTTDTEVQPDIDSEYDTIFESVVDWFKAMRGGDDPPLPQWAEELHFPEDEDRGKRVAELERDVQDLMKQIAEIRTERARDDLWKQLITANGHTLEARVAEAMELFGFELVGESSRRRDLHLRLGDRMAVVEVKGLSKSASEANAAQLEKWVAEALAETGKTHKGILVVNAWRDTNIRTRTLPAFPDQMLRYSTAREHSLVTGLQLLCMVRSILNGAASKETLAASILDNVGLLKGWDDPSILFAETAIIQAASAT